ncbi:MAG: methyltransferase domain-containing protein [Dehalococcoidia bacterium]
MSADAADAGEARVAAGYDAVYEALPRSATFQLIWRAHALGEGYPEGFEHISFLTLAEMRRMAEELRLAAGASLVDLGCGMGGPGLWIARETGAGLTGIDLSGVAVEHARRRAEGRGLSAVARFATGSFAQTGLIAASADGAMSVDALQYAPDKRAALREAARVLRPGGRLVFACFELEPAVVAGLPVLGIDPVDDYGPLLEQAGFDVTSYEETAGWLERLTAAYQGLVDAKGALTEEMGEGACNALLGEVSLTLQLRPYRRRVFVSATRR